MFHPAFVAANEFMREVEAVIRAIRLMEYDTPPAPDSHEELRPEPNPHLGSRQSAFGAGNERSGAHVVAAWALKVFSNHGMNCHPSMLALAAGHQ